MVLLVFIVFIITTENIEGQVGYYQINVDLSKYTYVDISNYRKIIHFQGNDTLGYWTNIEGRIIGEDIILFQMIFLK